MSSSTKQLNRPRSPYAVSANSPPVRFAMLSLSALISLTQPSFPSSNSRMQPWDASVSVPLEHAGWAGRGSLATRGDCFNELQTHLDSPPSLLSTSAKLICRCSGHASFPSRPRPAVNGMTLQGELTPEF